MQRKSTRAKRHGAHLVEFAVVAPVFFLFVIALVDIGRGMMVNSILANAARAGCRVGTLPGKANSDIQATVTQTLSATSVANPTVIVQVNGVTADASTAQTKDLITVTVAVPVTSVSWLPVQWFVSGNLTGQFSLEHE